MTDAEPASPGAPSGTATERPPSPMRMQPRERRIAFLLAAAAVPAFAVMQQPWKGGDRPLLVAAGAGLAALLAGAGWWGNRAAGTMGAFAVAFGPWGALPVLGTPYMAFGFLLSFRASRDSRAVADARRASSRAAATDRRGRAGAAPARTLGIESGRVTPKGTPRRRPQKRRR